jgi:nicotinate phosphoribosyltransferase
MLARGAPIDAFGVGTSMGVSRDAPDLDIAYKLVEYGGRGRLKSSPGKATLPGAKQVFRFEDDGGRALYDVIASRDEELSGRPLLRPVLCGGTRTAEREEDLGAMRARARREIGSLPDRIRALDPANGLYPVEVTEELWRRRRAVEHGVQRWNG